MAPDADLLLAFENQFDPARPTASRVPFTFLGHGHLSAVFHVESLDGVALRRLPPFPDAATRGHFERAVNAYHRLLRDPIGLHVVDQACLPLTNDAGEHLLYIAQTRLPAESFGHRVFQEGSDLAMASTLLAVLQHTLRVWHRNEIEKELEVPDSLTGLDARLSNWSVVFDGDRASDVVYVDTDLPFIRRMGRDRLDPALFLQGMPSSLAGLVRGRLSDELRTRYYDLRLVLIDLLAELHGLDRPDRLGVALGIVNRFLETDADDLYIDPIRPDEIVLFARQNARFRQRFRTFCRLRRFTSTHLGRRPYPLVLANSE